MKESFKKLDQIIQNFYYKAACLILQSRITTTPNPRKANNSWFGFDTEEIDDFRDELRVYKQCGGFENRPPAMIIESYLDASKIHTGQTLVAVDDEGERYDVLEALNEASSGSGSPPSSRKNDHVILERWRVELRGFPEESPQEEFGPLLPTIYKHGIVFFRSLFTTTHLSPVWRLARRSMKGRVHPALHVRCRFRMDDPETAEFDALRHPLMNQADAVTDYVFADLEVPAGRLYVSVAWRNECEFMIDDNEAVQSLRAIPSLDFKPTVMQGSDGPRRDSLADLGSRHSDRYSRSQQQPPQQTYGSLSTFHGAGAMGTSPISALRAIKPIGSDTSSPPASPSASAAVDFPQSLPISGQMAGARRGLDTTGRRPSVSFNPFKAGSLSQSPRIGDDIPSSPRAIIRPAGPDPLTQARNRSSLTAGMAASLRGGPQLPAETTPSSASPRPAGSRYSSSFTHRRGRSSFSGASKAEDEQGSSGKQSLASSAAQPGSGLLAEAAGGSSGSFPTDDDNISDFINLLESKKTLSSFDPSKKGESATKRTVAQLSRYHQMRDSNKDLTESMNSSLHLHPSSGTSSRQLTSVPGGVNAASLSTSSSPIKPLSPHAPHTPAIPSRLSENSIIDYQGQSRTTRSRLPSEPITAEESEDAPVSQEGANAIDIPLSPRLYSTGRPTSAVQQGRAEDDESEPAFADNRNLSLGADEREPTPSALFGMDQEQDDNSSLQPPARIRPSTGARTASSSEQEGSLGRAASSASRRRYQGMPSDRRGSRQTPPQSSRGSFSGSARYSAQGGRHGEGEADDEPLVFDMSELGREQNRRSLEEGRGGLGSGSGPSDRGGYDSGRSSRRGW